MTRRLRRSAFSVSNQLPVDSDIEIDDRREAREPSQFRWRNAGLVFVGGAVGTALREILTMTVPVASGVSVVTLGINVVGAFSLGVLVEALLTDRPRSSVRRALRVFVGTGLLGGFTTYGALAMDSARLIEANRPMTALGYSIGTIMVGAAAAWAGIVCAARRNAGAAGARRASRTRGEQ